MKIRLSLLLFLLVLCAPIAATAAPVVFLGGIVNTASFVPSGVPQYGIAQGSIFAIFGSGLGPATIQFTAFPLKTSLAGTSVQITEAGVNYNALLIFTSDGQVAAILPSAVPVGNAQLTVVFNGQVSNQTGFRVVQGAFGMFTANQQGTGPAILQNFVSQASQPFNNIATPAQAGQTVILWGTGLGPYSGDETIAPTAGTIGNNVSVTVGDQPAAIQYNGRTPCCSGEDEIVFTVPQGVSGCYVPIKVSANGIVSNAGTMAISSGNGSCAGQNNFLAALIPLLQSKASVNIGSVRLIRQDQQVTQGGVSSDVTSDRARGGFANFTSSSILSAPEISGTYVTAPYCGNYTFSGPNGFLGQQVSPASANNAGSALTVTGSNGAKQVLPSGQGEFDSGLGASLGSPGLFLSPGNYTVSGAGGANVGVFQAATDMPSTPFVWTNESSLSNIPKGQNLTVTWSGGDPNSIVVINGYSLSTQSSAGAGFICVSGVAAGQMVINTSVLSVLPGTQGELRVDNRLSNSFQATGIDSGLGNVSAITEFDKAVTYGNAANPGSCGNPNLAGTDVNLAGTATALSGNFPIACINGVNTGTAQTGSASVSLTGTTANNQTTYKGSITGSGTMTCPDGSQGNWSVNIPLTVNVSPSIASLSAGGSISQNSNFNFSGPPAPSVSFCNNSQFSGTALLFGVDGTVSSGGNVILQLGTAGGGNVPLLVTGTAASVSGALPGNQFFGNSATGSIAFTLTGTTTGQAAPSGQTSYAGSATGSGSVNCSDVTGVNTTGTWTGTLTVNTTIAPSVPSLASSGGGNALGTGSFNISVAACGITDQESGLLTSTGSVTSGGAVTLLVQ